MSFMWNVEILIIALVVVRISQWLYRWSNPNVRCNGKLPPGSMGFPIIGETIEFFKPCELLEIPSFFQNRMQRSDSSPSLNTHTYIYVDSFLAERKCCLYLRLLCLHEFYRYGSLFRSNIILA